MRGRGFVVVGMLVILAPGAALAVVGAPQRAEPTELRAPWLPLAAAAAPAIGHVREGANGSWIFLGAVRPRQVANGDSAAAVARAFALELAGGRLGDGHLEVLAVEPMGQDAVVQLVQVVRGVPILGSGGLVLLGPTGVRFSQLRFVAPPALDVRPRLGSVEATRRARAGRRGWVRGPGEPRLAIAHVAGVARLVWLVDAAAPGAAATWRSVVDARHGEVLTGWSTTLSAVQGNVSFAIEPLCQGEATTQVRMPHVQWTNGGYTGDDGGFSSTASLSSASIELKSPYFLLVNMAGALAGPWSYPLAAAPAVNELVVSTAPFDQADPFYHAHRVRAWVRARAEGDNSQIQWTEAQVRMEVNNSGECNASYRLADQALVFYDAAAGCNNSGRVAGVVYHEYGHGAHDHSVPGGLGALVTDLVSRNDVVSVAEAVADYVTATIRDDPAIRGLYTCGSAFRTCDSSTSFCASGCTYGPSSFTSTSYDPYAGGRPLASSLWDFRSAMIRRYGFDAGVATADRIFMRYAQLATSMTSSFTSFVAVDDDDDGDPSNGTTHSCEINEAFANTEPVGNPPHFPDFISDVPRTPSVSFVHHAPGVVEVEPGTVPTLELFAFVDPGCAQGAVLENVVIHYAAADGVPRARLLSKADTTADGDRYPATLDDLAAPVTVTYYFTAELAGTELVYPPQGTMARSTGWPFYRLTARFGRMTTLYFSDFEADDGGLTTGVADGNGVSDWQWGEPSDIGGDPSHAFSGSRIWGTDLGGDGDGLYQAAITTWVELPVIDASSWGEVRLQFWRKLLNADVARIEVNGQRAFENRVSLFYWRDPDWVLQDLDISAWAAGQREVRIRFVMFDAYNRATAAGSPTPELGGWNIDDVRVVGADPLGPGGPGDDPDAGSASGTALVGRSCSAATPKLGFLVVLALAWRRRRGR